MNKDKTPPTNNNAQNPANTGVIHVRDKDNDPCHLFAAEIGSGKIITYAFTASDSLCNNDTARTVQFSEFPSATIIFLSDGDKHSHNQDQSFWFEVKTTRKRTSTIIRNLEDFDSYQPGDIIEPGLQLIGKFRKNSNAQIRDALSCVCIHAATSPPKPDQNS